MMKKFLQSIVTLLFVSVLAGCVAQNTPSGLQSSEDTPSAQMTDGSSEGIQLTEDMRYVAFSPEVLAETADRKRVLFFYATWCPTCKPVNEELHQRTSEIPDDVSVIRVNYNDADTDADEKALAQK